MVDVNTTVSTLVLVTTVPVIVDMSCILIESHVMVSGFNIMFASMFLLHESIPCRKSCLRVCTKMCKIHMYFG